MNFRVIPARLLPLNRPCNCILLCLKEGGVWEISDNSALPSLLLFICSGRDQFWAAVYSCIRARRIKNHTELEKCASCGSLRSVPWYLSLAHFTDTQVFPPCVEDVASCSCRDCTAPLLLPWDGGIFPNPAPCCRCGKEKTSGDEGALQTPWALQQPSLCAPCPILMLSWAFSYRWKLVEVTGALYNSKVEIKEKTGAARNTPAHDSIVQPKMEPKDGQLAKWGAPGKEDVVHVQTWVQGSARWLPKFVLRRQCRWRGWEEKHRWLPCACKTGRWMLTGYDKLASGKEVSLPRKWCRSQNKV